MVSLYNKFLNYTIFSLGQGILMWFKMCTGLNHDDPENIEKKKNIIGLICLYTLLKLSMWHFRYVDFYL